MYESTGRLELEGLMEGGAKVPRSFGLFDECIDTKGPEWSNATYNGNLFNGKYCSVFFNVEVVQLLELSPKQVY